ncbi:hypothetical protein [Leptolyngbya sp. O-77]|nr:hypothetical protein [Leptolyngbya sp. O-77]BAU42033.1 hypothetical protein O77CONTIG1_01851 [Leptolyngbya sp. O-77]
MNELGGQLRSPPKLFFYLAIAFLRVWEGAIAPQGFANALLV